MILEEDPRFKNLERKIGIFIVTAVVSIAVALTLFGIQKGFFIKKYNLSFTVDRGTGFSKGMPVKLSGFRIGKVTSIALNDQARIDINIEIDKKYKSWIRSDSTTRLIKEGLVGDTIVEISIGSPNRPELQENDKITYVKTKALDEIADEIAEKVKPVLSEVRDIISYINDPQGDLKKTIYNLEQLTRNLEETRRHTNSLILTTNRTVERVGNKASLTLDTTNQKINSLDLQTTMTKTNSVLDQIDKKLPALLAKTDATIENIRIVSDESRKVSQKTLPRIPGLVTKMEEVILSSDRLINSIQNTWLLRDDAIPQQNGVFIRGDSHE